MKLSIKPLATPARVVLPFRLLINPADLRKFQAATMSSATFVDAEMEFGPDDFDSDDERIAATQLGHLLETEELNRSSGHWYGAEAIVPGRVTLTAAYPYDEEAVREAARGQVKLAVRQQAGAVAARESLLKWQKAMEPKARALAEDAAKKHQQWIKRWSDLNTKAEGAIEALDEKILSKLKGEYKRLAQQFPDVERIGAEIVEELKLLPSPAFSRVEWRVTKSMVFGTSSTHDGFRHRTEDKDPPFAITATLGPGHMGRGDPKITIDLQGGGSLIPSVHERAGAIALPALTQFFATGKEVSHIREYGAYLSSNPTITRIDAAIETIERQKVVNEMNAWIAKHGSERLRKGVELGHSMMRQYREERAAFVLRKQWPGFSDWTVCVDPETQGLGRVPPKASPSAAALEALEKVRVIAPKAFIGFCGGEEVDFYAVEDEVIYIADGECFPSSPEMVIYHGAPAPAKRGRKH